MKKTEVRNEQGFVLITCLVMLTILMIIGISITTTTDLELQIAGNDKAGKMTFYAADAGNQMSKELIEVSIEERGWQDEAATTKSYGSASIINKGFYLSTTLTAADTPTSTDRDVEFPFDRGETYIKAGGTTSLLTGGNIVIGSSDVGQQRIYNVRTRHEGVVDSEAQILGQWRHVY